MSFLQLRSRPISKTGISSSPPATTYTVTVTAKARVKLTVSQTVTAKARVRQLGITKTVTVKARVKTSGTTKTVTAKARIKNTTTRTVTAKARIKNTTTRTVTAKARVKQLAVTKTVTAKARIKTAGTTVTVTAKARVKNTTTRTVTAKSRVKTLAVTKTVTAKGRVKTTGTTKTVTAKARVKQTRGYEPFLNESMAAAPSKGTLKNSAVWNAGGYLRLTPVAYSDKGHWEFDQVLPSYFDLSFDIWAGGGDGADAIWFYMGNSSTPNHEIDDTGAYHVYFSEYNNQAAIRFYGSELAAYPYNNFDDSTWRTIRIIKRGNRFIVSMDGTVIMDLTDSTRTLGGTLMGFGARTGGLHNEHRIKNVTMRWLGTSIDGRARVKQVVTKTATAKARVKGLGVTKTVTAKARIKTPAVTKTVTAKASITGSVTTLTKTVTAKARVKSLGATRSVTSKARVKKLAQTATVAVKSRIKTSGTTTTVSSKARVKLTLSRTLQAKARVLYNRTTTVTARVRVRSTGTIKTVGAKARVKRLSTTRTVSAKANVLSIGRLKFYRLFQLDDNRRNYSREERFTKRRDYSKRNGNYINIPVQYK